MRKIPKRVEKPHTLYEINGEKHRITEWCRIYNIPYEIVRLRMQRGYYLQEALEEPYKKSRAGKSDGIKVDVDGVQYTSIRKLAEAYKLDVTTLYARYRRGLRGAELVAPPNIYRRGRDSGQENGAIRSGKD